MTWTCPTCAGVNEDNSGICTHCYAVRPSTPLLPPEPPVLQAATSPIPSGAGFGIRLVARLIDTTLGLLLGLAVGIVMVVVFAIWSRVGHLAPDWPQRMEHTGFAGVVFGLFGSLLYHTLAEGLGAASVGKLACGLRVLRLDGRPAGLGAALLRSLAFYVDGLFCGLIGYDAMSKSALRQRYGDAWAKTVVVRTKVFAPAVPPSGWRLALGILSGLLAWGSMLGADALLKVL